MPNRNDRSRQVAARLEQADAAPGLPVVVQTMGAYRLQVGDTTISTRSGMVFPLLVRLLYSPGFSAPRGQVLDALWPDEADARRNGNLRQLLYKLRLMGLDIVQVDELIRLSPAQVKPVFAVERSEARFIADVESGTQPFGEFLPAWQGPSPLYQEWLDQTRATVHADTRRILVEHLRAARERADWPVAERYARWLRQFDPLNEDAALVLAESTMLNGSKAEAVAMLDDYLEELGPDAKEIRLPAAQLKRRILKYQDAANALGEGMDSGGLVGRKMEKELATNAIRRAKWRSGSIVHFSGIGGIGKTSLMQELEKIALIEGAIPLIIRHREVDSESLLQTWIEAVPSLLSLRGALGCAPSALATLQGLARNQFDQGNNVEDGPQNYRLPDYGDKKRDYATISRSLLEVLISVSEENPITLILEDCHWADSQSIELLSLIAARLNSLCITVFVTTKSEHGGERPSKYLCAIAEPIYIKRFNESEATELVASVCAKQELDLAGSEIRWIIRCGEGVPLYIKALIEHCASAGSISDAPPTLNTLFKNRLSKVPPNAVRLLQIIYLLDRHSTAEAVRTILELPAFDFFDALEALEANDCIRHSKNSLSPTHELIGKAAISYLSPATEAAIRTSIASHIEKLCRSKFNSGLFLECLLHLEKAEHFELALRLVEDFSHELLHANHPPFVSFIDRILVSSSNNRINHPRVEALRDKLLIDAGDYETAFSLFPSDQPSSRDLNHNREDEIIRHLGYIESAFRSDPLTDPNELAKLATIAALNAELSFNTRLRATDIALVIASNTCNETIANDCYSWLHKQPLLHLDNPSFLRTSLIFNTVFGSIDTANELAHKLYRNASTAAPSTAAATDSGRAGYVFRMTGEIQLAKTCFLLSRHVAKQVGADRLAEYPAWQLAQLAIDSGDFDVAQYWTDELVALTSNNSDLQENYYIHGHLCLLAIAKNDPIASDTSLQRCRSALARIPHQRSLAFLTALEILSKATNTEWIPTSDVALVAAERLQWVAKYAGADLIATAVIEAQLRSGKTAEALQTSNQYLLGQRRERCAESHFLRTAINKLKR